jgi:hypothetical protein
VSQICAKPKFIEQKVSSEKIHDKLDRNMTVSCTIFIFDFFIPKTAANKSRGRKSSALVP